MILNKTTKNIFTLILMVLIFTISSCNMPTINRALEDDIELDDTGLEDNELDDVEKDDLAVMYTEPSLTLEWDYDTATPVDYFNLYYRSHNSADWTLFVSTESSLAEFTIDHSSLGDGDWDFGVTSVAFDGAESEIHSSLDTTALPDTGWFITWNI